MLQSPDAVSQGMLRNFLLRACADRRGLRLQQKISRQLKNDGGGDFMGCDAWTIAFIKCRPLFLLSQISEESPER